MEAEESSERLLKTITECLDGGLVTGFVVMASFIDPDGERLVFSDTMENQRCHETIGLLGYGLAVEQGKAADSFRDS